MYNACIKIVIQLFFSIPIIYHIQNLANDDMYVTNILQIWLFPAHIEYVSTMPLGLIN